MIAMASAVIANAQDPSTWTEGQDVTDQIMLGEHDGTWTGVPNEHNGPYWQGSVPTEFETHDGVGVMGFYFDGKSQGNLIDIYQVVKVPAGHYTIKVQALYREGTPYDTFNSFFAGFPKKNAHLYASALASNDAAAEVTKAEQAYEVARLQALEAKEIAKKIREQGEAEAHAARLKVAAGLTPLEAATIEKETTIGVAQALAGSQVRWVPEVMVVGGNGNNAANPMDAVGLNMLLEIAKKQSK